MQALKKGQAGLLHKLNYAQAKDSSSLRAKPKAKIKEETKANKPAAITEMCSALIVCTLDLRALIRRSTRVTYFNKPVETVTSPNFQRTSL